MSALARATIREQSMPCKIMLHDENPRQTVHAAGRARRGGKGAADTRQRQQGVAEGLQRGPAGGAAIFLGRPSARPTAMDGWRCEAWCASPCAELNGDSLLDECGGCPLDGRGCWRGARDWRGSMRAHISASGHETLLPAREVVCGYDYDASTPFVGSGRHLRGFQVRVRAHAKPQTPLPPTRAHYA